MVSRIFYPRKTGKTRRPTVFVPRHKSGLSRKWVGLWVSADWGVSRNEPLKQRRGFFLLCIILEAFFQVVSHFTFLRQEGQVLLIALHRHHNAARSDLMNPDLTRLTQREKVSPFGESKHRVWLVTGKAGDCLPHLFCGKPAPLAENETLRRVSAYKAVCAALREGEGSGATLRIKPLLTAVWSRIRPGNLTNELKFCPFDKWAK